MLLCISAASAADLYSVPVTPGIEDMEAAEAASCCLNSAVAEDAIASRAINQAPANSVQPTMGKHQL